MTVPNRTSRLLVICAAATSLAIAGCKSTSEKVSSASEEAAVQQNGWSGRQAVSESIALLNQGESAKARGKLLKVLKHQPNDAIARRLLDQIEKDPKVLLGTEHFSYTVRSGDTYSTLAGKYLGDPMLFYALARYNGLSAPTALPDGKMILIPGKRPAAARKETPKPVAKREPATARPASPPAPAKPAAASSDPARASKLRGMALAAMNSGAIDRAVALLRQAAAADPANAAVKADLGRALRIQSTVRSR